MRKSDKPLLIFIAGTGRCGSTILEVALSAIEGITALGEVRYIWDRGMQQDRLCGSGRPFSDEPFWQETLKKAYDPLPRKDRIKGWTAMRNALRMRWMFGPYSKAKHKKLIDRAAPYTVVLQELYDAAVKTSRARVLIDSSKLPMHGLSLQQLEGFEVKVLHIERDPLAVAHSWATPKFDRGKGGMMSQKPLLGSILESVFVNHWIETYLGHNPDNYIHIDYATFSAKPQETLSRILGFLGLTKADNPIDETGSFSVRRHPTISGNPVRFDDGSITIREDKRWKASMPFWRKAVAKLYLLIFKPLSKVF